MALEGWLPIGLVLPDGARCGKCLHGGPDWQIVATEGGGRALIAQEPLQQKWLVRGLIDAGGFGPFSFGSMALFAASSPARQRLAPVDDCPSPNSRAEALAFAQAVQATRSRDPDSPLQDAIYFEKLARLLPTYGISARTDDDLVLGQWLTGGARVSARASRRLGQIMSWLDPRQLADVVAASGVVQIARSAPAPGADLDSREAAADAPAGAAAATAWGAGEPFKLPGRTRLESFFNEHVVDIVRHKERYAALGVGFPAAIVLHGPPGCGKTFAVEKLVEFLGWPSFQIDASSVASPYIHETSRKVAEVFAKAMQAAPSVIIIDEMEAFLADRESGHGSSHHRVEEVAEFLRRIPEAAGHEVLVIGMTNRVEMIDPAILRRGRFDHVIGLDPATEEEIGALLDTLLQQVPAARDVDARALAAQLVGRPLSDAAFVVREGARLSARAGLARVEQRFLVEALASAGSRNEPGTGRRIGFV